jgi:hypothetical protein
MAGLSRYLQRAALNHILKGSAYTQPAHIYVALLTASAECAGTGYAREICDAWDAASDADPSVAANTGIIDFGSAGGADWGTLTRFALYDALTGGNLLWDITALTASKAINSGDPVTFPSGALTLSLD